MEGSSLRSLQPHPPESSPLARARIRAELTLDEAALRAGITVDQARWLEEERLYRFADAGAAIAATIAYAAALGAGRDEDAERRRRTRERARPRRRRRLVAAGTVVLAAGIAAAALAALRTGPGADGTGAGRAATGAAGAETAVAAAGSALAAAQPAGGLAGGATATALPARSAIRVAVVSWRGAAAGRTLAERVRRLGYGSGGVTAPERPGAGGVQPAASGVYYEPGGAAAGAALGRLLGLPTLPLPGGRDPLRLVVVLGPP